MANRVLPTKSQLLATKKSLKLAKKGFELLDRKRNVLIREIMMLLDQAGAVQDRIDVTFAEAYAALELANITLGNVDDLATTVPFDDGLNVAYRSVMGVELPMVNWEETPMDYIPYGMYSSNKNLDDAYLKFVEVKRMAAELAEIENSVFRLSDAIKKTTRRANALKNIIIPRFKSEIKFITEALEEKDREEFSRMKIIKANKLKAAIEEEEKLEREKLGLSEDGKIAMSVASAPSAKPAYTETAKTTPVVTASTASAEPAKVAEAVATPAKEESASTASSYSSFDLASIINRATSSVSSYSESSHISSEADVDATVKIEEKKVEASTVSEVKSESLDEATNETSSSSFSFPNISDMIKKATSYND